MEPIFYDINEEAARQANLMNSFRPFVPGNATREYQAEVKEAFGLAGRVIELNPDYEDEAERLANSYSKKLAEWYNKQFSIESQYPSIMISGAGNFSESKKEKQNAARDRHWHVYQDIQSIKERIGRLAHKKAAIKSSDTKAIEKLESKIVGLKESQEIMKAVNAYYRKYKTLEGCPNISEDTIHTLTSDMKQSWHLSDVPFGSYALTNNRQNMRAAEDRLRVLKITKERGNTESKAVILGHPVEIKENTEAMRLQLIFDGKPNDEVRTLLKKSGFKWSPKNTAWQRQLTDNARFALKRVIEHKA